MTDNQDVMNSVMASLARMKAHWGTPEAQAVQQSKEASLARIQRNRAAADASERDKNAKWASEKRWHRAWQREREERAKGRFKMRPEQGEPVTPYWFENYVAPYVPDMRFNYIPPEFGRFAIAFGIDIIRGRKEQGRPVPSADRVRTVMSGARYYRERHVCFGTAEDAANRPEAVLQWRWDIDFSEPVSREEYNKEEWEDDSPLEDGNRSDAYEIQAGRWIGNDKA